MKKIGIVFSGGGGKGAYQIGVWKALQEYKIQATVVSGTSVGALNGALYVQGDYEKAYNAWAKVDPKNILSINENYLSSETITTLGSLGINVGALPNYIKTKGIFSQNGLLKMMEESLEVNKLYDSNIPLYICAHSKSKNQVRYFHVNNEQHKNDEKRFKKILLASAAIPFVFDNIEIDGDIYYDGGCPSIKGYSTDNSPVLPVYNHGCDVIIWIALSRDDYQDYKRFPNAKILPIVPSADLGGLVTGTLDFSSQGAKRRMEQGYDDAVTILKHTALFIEQEAAYKKLWERIALGEKTLFENHVRIKKEVDHRGKLLENIQKFNQGVLKDDLVEEIDIYSKLERDLLSQSNKGLLEDIERREINIWVDDCLSKNLDNSTAIEQMALEAVSLLAPIEGRTSGLAEKNIFSRILGGVTGKTTKDLASNERDLARAQYAAMKVISQMQQKNLLSFEFTVSLNNKVNWLFTEIASVNKQINQQCIDMYHSLSIVFFKLRQEILKDRRRIDALEDRVGQLEWMTKIQVLSYLGREYRHLNLSEKIVCVVNDFYNLTGGDWTVKELLSLKKALIDLGIENRTITVNVFFECLIDNPNLTLRLLENFSKGSDLTKSALVEGTQIIKERQIKDTNELQRLMLSHDEDLLIDKDPIKLSEASWNGELPVFYFVLELLVGIRRCGYNVMNKSKLEGVKGTYIETLGQLMELVEKHRLSGINKKEIEDLKENVIFFKVKMPLIGAYSSGKSSLLNAYINKNLFKTSLPPETSLATELHYASPGEEKVVASFINGEKEEYPLSEIANMDRIAGDILYLEIYINSPILSTHKDIILVDMPGLDSDIASHNKAIANYVSQGVSLVLCIETGQTLKQSVHYFIREMNLYNIDISVLLTKNEKRPKEELPMLMEEIKNIMGSILFRTVSIKNVSAFQRDLNGLYQILEEVEERKNQLFIERFDIQLRAIGHRIKQSLKLLLNEENLTMMDIEKKKADIQKALEELKRIMEKEKQELFKECQQILPNVVVGDVRRALSHVKSSMVKEVKAGVSIEERIKGVVINTFQLSIKEHSSKAFERVSNNVSRYVSQHIYMKSYDEARVDINIKQMPTISIMADMKTITGAVAIGAIIAGPIGGLIGGIIGGIGTFFNRAEKEKQISEAVGSAINQVAESVKGEASRVLNQMSQDFYLGLEEKVEEVKKEMLYNISLLEEQLKKGNKEIERNRNELLKDVEFLDQALELPFEEISEAI